MIATHSNVDIFSAISPRMGAVAAIRQQIRQAMRKLGTLTKETPRQYEQCAEALDEKIGVASGIGLELTALILSPLRDASEYQAFQALAGKQKNDRRALMRTTQVTEALRLHNLVLDLSASVLKADLAGLRERYVATMILHLGGSLASLAVDTICRNMLSANADESKLDCGKLKAGWVAYNFKSGCLALPRRPTPIANKLRELSTARHVSRHLRRVLHRGLVLGSLDGNSFIVPSGIADYVQALATAKFAQIATILR